MAALDIMCESVYNKRLFAWFVGMEKWNIAVKCGNSQFSKILMCITNHVFECVFTDCLT